MQIFCDFDGTISIGDVTDIMLNRFADTHWLTIEDEWKAGKIGSAECMQRQIPLIGASKAELDEALDSIEIDAGFVSFVRLCQTQNIPLTIISDGVDYFIARILARHHLPVLPILANHLEIAQNADGATTYKLSSPFSAGDCTAGVCKCRAVGGSFGKRVFVGDGQSDFCVSNKPELVFAKGKLATFCDEQGIDYTAYTTFFDVAANLESELLPLRKRAGNAQFAIA